MSLTEGKPECKSCRYATMEPFSLDCSRTMPLYLGLGLADWPHVMSCAHIGQGHKTRHVLCPLCEGKYRFTVPFSQALPFATMLCVCVKMSIHQQENEMFSCELHTPHKVFHPPNQMSVWIHPLA